MTDTSSANGIVPWLLATMATLAATLSSALAYIYRQRESENTNRIVDLKAESTAFRNEIDALKLKSDTCEKDRAELSTIVAVNTLKIKILEDRESATEAVSKVIQAERDVRQAEIESLKTAIDSLKTHLKP